MRRYVIMSSSLGEYRKTGYIGPGTGESMGGKVSCVEVMQGRLSEQDLHILRGLGRDATCMTSRNNHVDVLIGYQ